ncbi:MAG: PIN domain-containing protein [Candidatus Diapherotrites archaeon]
MRLIVDTNIVVGALIRREGDTRKLLFSPQLELFSPEISKLEMVRNKADFMSKAKLDESGFSRALDIVFENVSIVPFKQYKLAHREALSLCPPWHEDDWPFFALALAKKCALWSNDKKLKSQPKIRVLATHELLKALGK